MKNLKIVMTAFIVGLGLLSFTAKDDDKNIKQKENILFVKGYEIGTKLPILSLKYRRENGFPK